ncbi:FGGY carbohydrate kinase domain-containing protein isoform X3 [Carcharodon carcharias]|uniref:FGGY carbohydrate kinase domain-containing protein isoform X3 n=1 Tax=Carcharodon carcharias TaxID=13397 RepID=UPI001B7E13C5|nr:FGGY carbohydrate kinase domain-containing protein isoform X3 [Carcharodon carcharias]
MKYYMGIDVGTASVRAALTDQNGKVVVQAEQPIQIWKPQPDYYEQSSDDIWAACCTVSKRIAQAANLCYLQGIGFVATCSLVVLDEKFEPLAVNAEGMNNRNIIMWMDHRAVDQVDRINRTKHRVLKYMGGVMSPEMQPPKLLWLKEKLRTICWEKAGRFFDLPDFLSWKATGATTRSLCTLICKWTYSAETGWNDCFWKQIGLGDLTVNNHSKIGNDVLSPGSRVGRGLTPVAAQALGLPIGIAVAASLIDAHAGGLGVIGADVKGSNLPCENKPITSRFALICGTSSCHMGISKDPIFVPGVWGPYYSVMVPGFWLNEGGQSATGKLVTGLALSNDLDDLAKLYLATIQALALGTRHILETMLTAGHQIDTIFMCGGLSKNLLFSQIHADISGMPVVLAKEEESVLVGAAILGACASGDFSSIQEAMEKMGKIGEIIHPDPRQKRFYDNKYKVFLKLVEHQKKYRAIMQNI